jgi:hypothetical protein
MSVSVPGAGATPLPATSAFVSVIA